MRPEIDDRPDSVLMDQSVVVDVTVAPPKEVRAALHAALAERLGRPVGEADMVRGAKGKPALAEPRGIGFNVTHCRDLGLVALAWGAEVGIDIERADRTIDPDLLARRTLCDAERATLAGIADPDARRRFVLRLWVRKEAVVKALGHGLTLGLATIDASRDTGRERPLGAEHAVAWFVADLDLPEHVAAVAALEARPAVRLGGADRPDSSRAPPNRPT